MLKVYRFKKNQNLYVSSVTGNLPLVELTLGRLTPNKSPPGIGLGLM